MINLIGLRSSSLRKILLSSVLLLSIGAEASAQIEITPSRSRFGAITATSIVTPAIYGSTSLIVGVNGSTGTWVFGTDGSLSPAASNSYDLGLTGTTVRSGYFGTKVVVPTIYGTTDLTIGVSGATGTWNFATSGNFRATPDNSFDIGDNATTFRPRTLYLGTSLIQGGTLNLTTTSTDGIVAQNTTAATGGATVQISPRIRMRGTAWDTGASQTVDFFMETLPTSAASPTGTLKFGYSLNGAAASYPLTLTSAGALTATLVAAGSSFISPLYRSNVAKVLLQGTGTGPTQVAMTQTTVPTCTSNCGTSPSIAGSDTAMIVTMGSSGVPASGWVVTFNGTWAAAPSCSVTPALAGMAVGKIPIAVVVSTTTITVTTNGVAPATNDKYAIQCFGIS